MSKDHVSQPMAARLKAAGWEGETEKAHFLKLNGLWECAPKHDAHFFATEWLPAPSTGELRERLTKTDFRDYWWNCVGPTEPYDALASESLYSNWLYTVTASADALAESWLFAQGKEGK